MKVKCDVQLHNSSQKLKKKSITLKFTFKSDSERIQPYITHWFDCKGKSENFIRASFLISQKLASMIND